MYLPFHWAYGPAHSFLDSPDLAHCFACAHDCAAYVGSARAMCALRWPPRAHIHANSHQASGNRNLRCEHMNLQYHAYGPTSAPVHIPPIITLLGAQKQLKLRNPCSGKTYSPSTPIQQRRTPGFVCELKGPLTKEPRNEERSTSTHTPPVGLSSHLFGSAKFAGRAP